MINQGIDVNSLLRRAQLTTDSKAAEDGKNVANRFAGLTVNKSVSEKIALEALSELAIIQEASNGEMFDIQAPVLRPGKENVRLTKDGRLLQLLAEFNSNNTNGEAATMVTKLTTMMAGAEARKARFENLALQFDAINAELGEAQDALESAVGDLVSKQQAYDSALTRRQQAEQALQQLKEAGISEDDPRYIAAASALENATQDVETARQNVSAATAHADALAAKAQSLIDKHSGMLKEMTVTASNERGKAVIAGDAMQRAQRESDSQLQRLVILLTSLITLLNEGNATKLKNDLAVNQARLDATRKTMLKKAAEHEEQIRKAEKAAKAASCAAKILGGLLSAIGMISAIFDGGVTLAIGVGVLVAGFALDLIKVNGKSLGEIIMSPLMKYIVEPFMKAIEKAIIYLMDKSGLTELLEEAYGEKKTKDIKNIVKIATAVVVAITVIVAASLLLKSGGKFISNKMADIMAKPIIQNIIAQIKKMIPEFVKNAAKGISSAVGNINNALTKQLTEGTRYKMTMYARTAEQALMFGKTATHSSGNIISASMYDKAQQALAETRLSENITEQLTKHVEYLMENMKRSEEATQALQIAVSDAQKKSHAATAFVAKNIRV